MCMVASRPVRVVYPGLATSSSELMRTAVEQTLVKWEDDSEVKKCRICL
jgi:hypothetical protein